MSVIEILAGPVIGAVIGYFTNYIAVKMLFRPFKTGEDRGTDPSFYPGDHSEREAQAGKSSGKSSGRKAPYQGRP